MKLSEKEKPLLEQLVQNFEEAKSDQELLDKHSFEELTAMYVKILEESLIDKYFQAYVYDSLYSADRDRALKLAIENIGSFETYILGCVISNITEDAGDSDFPIAYVLLVKKLGQEIESRPAAEIDTIKDEVEWFTATFFS